MRSIFSGLAAIVALGLSASTIEAMPIGLAAGRGDLPVVSVAAGCGPGLVRGRLGTCLRRPTVFSRSGRILRKGCGKPLGAGLRTPC